VHRLKCVELIVALHLLSRTLSKFFIRRIFFCAMKTIEWFRRGWCECLQVLDRPLNSQFSAAASNCTLTMPSSADGAMLTRALMIPDASRPPSSSEVGSCWLRMAVCHCEPTTAVVCSNDQLQQRLRFFCLRNPGALPDSRCLWTVDTLTWIADLPKRNLIRRFNCFVDNTHDSELRTHVQVG
jgi:hypothetical protein